MDRAWTIPGTRVDTRPQQEYRIIVLCRIAHCSAVNQLVRAQLDATSLAIDLISDETDACQRLAHIVARVHCTMAERSTVP